MNPVTPADRDRAQQRVRRVTMATAGAAGILTLAGAAAAAGTFAGRTVSSPTTTADQGSQLQPTYDPGTGLQQPIQPPGSVSNSGFSGGVVVPSGGS